MINHSTLRGALAVCALVLLASSTSLWAQQPKGEAVQAYVSAAHKSIDAFKRFSFSKEPTDSDRVTAMCRLARSLAVAGAGEEFRQTMAEVSQVISKLPDDARATPLREVAPCFAMNNQMDAANETIGNISDGEQRVWALIDIAKALHQRGNVDEARKVLARAQKDAAGIDPASGKPGPARDAVRTDASGNRAFSERDIAIAQAKLGMIDDARLTAARIKHPGIREVAEAAIRISEIRAVAALGKVDEAKLAARQLTDAYASASAYREVAEAQASRGDLIGAEATIRDASKAAARAEPEFLQMRATREIAVVVARVQALRGDLKAAEATAGTLKADDEERVLAERMLAQARAKAPNATPADLLQWASSAPDASVSLARIEGLLDAMQQ